MRFLLGGWVVIPAASFVLEHKVDIQIKLMQLEEQAIALMKQAESVGDAEWVSSYRGQAYAFKVARTLIREMMQQNVDEAMRVNQQSSAGIKFSSGV